MIPAVSDCTARRQVFLSYQRMYTAVLLKLLAPRAANWKTCSRGLAEPVLFLCTAKCLSSQVDVFPFFPPSISRFLFVWTFIFFLLYLNIIVQNCILYAGCKDCSLTKQLTVIVFEYFNLIKRKKIRNDFVADCSKRNWSHNSSNGSVRHMDTHMFTPKQIIMQWRRRKTQTRSVWSQARTYQQPPDLSTWAK